MISSKVTQSNQIHKYAPLIPLISKLYNCVKLNLAYILIFIANKSHTAVSRSQFTQAHHFTDKETVKVTHFMHRNLFSYIVKVKPFDGSIERLHDSHLKCKKNRS